MKQRVGHEVTPHLLGGASLGLEDQGERVGLPSLEVQGAGDFEPVPDLSFHRHR